MLNNPSYVIEALIVVALDTPTNFTADAGQGEVTLKWTDPVDKYATPEGETAQDPQQLVAKWSHTLVVRNTDHQPESPDDGTVILTSSVRNQYQTNGYVDNTVVNGTPYYYGVFAISTAGVPSAGAFASATPRAGTPLSELTEGTLITINENGAPVEFYVSKQGYEPTLNGPGRVLMVRSESPRDLTWGWVKSYENSNMNKWFNNTYKTRFSSDVISMMGTTTFPYIMKEDDNDLVNTTLSVAISALSSIELGCTIIFNPDNYHQGSVLPIATTLRKYPGQWSRTPFSRNDSPPSILQNGEYSLTLESTNLPTLPAFTLPSTALVDSNNALIET